MDLLNMALPLMKSFHCSGSSIGTKTAAVIASQWYATGSSSSSLLCMAGWKCKKEDEKMARSNAPHQPKSDIEPQSQSASAIEARVLGIDAKRLRLAQLQV